MLVWSNQPTICQPTMLVNFLDRSETIGLAAPQTPEEMCLFLLRAKVEATVQSLCWWQGLLRKRCRHGRSECNAEKGEDSSIATS